MHVMLPRSVELGKQVLAKSKITPALRAPAFPIASHARRTPIAQQ